MTIRGVVQGVGFRPFIYRLATELQLVGWVNNSASGVFIEVEGERYLLDAFLSRIPKEKPPRSQIQSIETTWLDGVEYSAFEIRPSVNGEKTAIVLPDLATCPDCLQDIFNPDNRRYRYPFTNCTHCGPRYTIIEALPYDRPHTTMKGFTMCAECGAEYQNPLDRRFHAQPNACPHCGPQLALWDTQGQALATQDAALQSAIDALREGKILAIKGLGGFHLMVDGRNASAVNQLRQRKCRPDKPFALMYPSLELIRTHCDITPLEEALLTSPEAPIVLLKRKQDSLGEFIAPGNPYWGIMLPYTPLHHLLLRELGFPLVATSGNLSDEPICIDEREALQGLGKIADLFLVHNRPITRPVDDSVVQVMAGRSIMLRRARGYAPLPIALPNTNTSAILAVGGHLKNTVAIWHGNQVFMSQHIGDLSTSEAFKAFLQGIKSLKELYGFEPQIIACDAHPDYLSTQFAQSQNLPVVRVQHHYAHVLSCMAENGLEAPVLGVAWDGTGYGTDGTIWGGEFLLITPDSYQRIAHFRPFRLPGAQKAIKEPRLIALGLLYEAFGSFDGLEKLPLFETFSSQELILVKQMLSRHLNAPWTSSVGRLFDAIASIVGICQQASFEGQGAMGLEYAIADTQTNRIYPYQILGSTFPLIVDWKLIVRGVLDDLDLNLSLGEITAKFHNTLAEIIIEVAQKFDHEKVILTGGCFQNKYLIERTILRLRQESFSPFWHQRIPPNDGGIALGQVIGAIRNHKLLEIKRK